MRLTHLGLPVIDVRRSVQFYSTYFGFDPDTAQRYPDGTVIVRDGHGFDLALHVVDEVGEPAEFLHFGFRLATPGEVTALRDRLAADGVEILEYDEEPALVSFKIRDPDGHRVETYWEPLQDRPGADGPLPPQDQAGR